MGNTKGMKQRVRVYGDGVRGRDERESLCGAFFPRAVRDGDSNADAT